MAGIPPITLPALNGSLEAGIAAGIDASLSTDYKLRIHDRTDPGQSLHACLRWAYHQFKTIEGYTDAETAIVLRAIYVLFQAKLIETKSSDVLLAPYTIREVNDNTSDATITNLIENVEASHALTIMVATKATWWLTNHHVGQGRMHGYAAKVYDTKFSNTLTDKDRAWKIFHMLGHWTSTREVLRLGGVEGLVDVSPDLFGTGGITVKLSRDAKLRFDSFPAGTHAVSVCYATTRLMITHPVGMLCPEVSTFAQLALYYKEINEDRANRHVGGYYLTGSPRRDDYNDVAKQYVGRLGTFLTKLRPKATLAKSPIYKDYMGADDWNDEYENVCIAYTTSRAKGLKDLEDTFKTNAVFANKKVMDDLANKFGIGVINQAQVQGPESDDDDDDDNDGGRGAGGRPGGSSGGTGRGKGDEPDRQDRSTGRKGGPGEGELGLGKGIDGRAQIQGGVITRSRAGGGISSANTTYPWITYGPGSHGATTREHDARARKRKAADTPPSGHSTPRKKGYADSSAYATDKGSFTSAREPTYHDEGFSALGENLRLIGREGITTAAYDVAHNEIVKYLVPKGSWFSNVLDEITGDVYYHPNATDEEVIKCHHIAYYDQNESLCMLSEHQGISEEDLAVRRDHLVNYDEDGVVMCLLRGFQDKGLIAKHIVDLGKLFNYNPQLITAFPELDKSIIGEALKLKFDGGKLISKGKQKKGGKGAKKAVESDSESVVSQQT